MLAYPINIVPDDNDTMLITCPSFPEVTTFVENVPDGVKEGVEHVRQAIEEAIAARIDAGGEIPPSFDPEAPGAMDHADAPVRISALSSIKTLLYVELQQSGLTRAELQRRLGWNRESVDRLFRLDHGSKLEQLEAAFRALGRQMILNVQEADRAA